MDWKPGNKVYGECVLPVMNMVFFVRTEIAYIRNTGVIPIVFAFTVLTASLLIWDFQSGLTLCSPFFHFLTTTSLWGRPHWVCDDLNVTQQVSMVEVELLNSGSFVSQDPSPTFYGLHHTWFSVHRTYQLQVPGALWAESVPRSMQHLKWTFGQMTCPVKSELSSSACFLPEVLRKTMMPNLPVVTKTSSLAKSKKQSAAHEKNFLLLNSPFFFDSNRKAIWWGFCFSKPLDVKSSIFSLVTFHQTWEGGRSEMRSKSDRRQLLHIVSFSFNLPPPHVSFYFHPSAPFLLFGRKQGGEKKLRSINFLYQGNTTEETGKCTHGSFFLKSKSVNEYGQETIQRSANVG